MRFKTILTVFILLFICSVVGLVFFIQSQRFGQVVSRMANDYISKHMDVQLNIESLDVSFFPPGIEVNNVSFEKNVNDTKIKVEANELGFYVGVVNVEESNFSLGEIRLSGAVVEINAPENNDPPIEKLDRKLIEQIFNYQSKIPIKVSNILVENTVLKTTRELLEIKRLRIIKEDNFIVRFYLSNLIPDEDLNLNIDEIYGDLVVGKENIQVRRARIIDDVHSLTIKGDIQKYPNLKNSYAKLIGETSVHLAHLNAYFKYPEIISISKGQLNSTFVLEYEKNKVSSKVDLAISDIESSILEAQNISSEIILNESHMKVQTLTLKNNLERFSILKPAIVYDISRKKVLPERVDARVSDLELNNGLKILPSLKSLKGRLNGELIFTYNNENLKFAPKDGFTINDLRLEVNPDKPFEILRIKEAVLSQSSFDVINEEFQMVSNLKTKNSFFSVKGMASSKKVEFQAIDSVVDLEDLGNIAQLDIKGAGKLNVLVKGPVEDVGINITGQTNNFEVLGYKLGQTDKDVSILLKDSDVVIHNVISKYKSTPIMGSGVINYEDLGISLKVSSLKSNYHDLLEILDPIFSKLDFLPSDLDFTSKLAINILGKTKMDELVIQGDVLFQDLFAYGESLSEGNINLNLEKEILAITGLNSSKGGGSIRGEFFYDFKDDVIDLNYHWDKIALSSFNGFKRFNLNFDGQLSGKLVGGGRVSDYNLNLNSLISNTKTSTLNFEDSQIYLGLSPKSYTGNANLFGKAFKTSFDFNTGAKDKSSFSVVADVDNIKPFAIAVLGNHLESENFLGQVKYNLDASFTNDLRSVNFRGQISKILFEHENFNVSYTSNSPEFIVRNSNIEKWDLSIDQPDLKIISKGTGTFSKDINIFHHTDLNSKILEILIPSILSADGYLYSKSSVVGKLDDYDVKVRSHADALSFTLDSIPVPLNKMKYDFEFKDNRLFIRELRTNLENGTFQTHGEIFFDEDYPDVNLKYSINRAEFPVLGRSLVNVSGDGIVIGNSPPYNVGGEIQINKAQIVNELNEFSTKTNALTQIRFLPEDQDSQIGKWFNLNLNVKTMTPAKITNSLMDISLSGELILAGSPMRPRAEGNLSAPVNSSRVFFKNNEYFIQKADLSFNPKKDISNPDFDVHAVTNISSYRVDAKAYGDLERFNFDLTSDPVLTRNSILSLIAFGYSDEIQSTLTQDQQQNLTQVGVGSFVFDRFKISDILNKQFGLQVNLGTVFEQSQTQSLLSGRSQEGQGTIGRTRTATKIELKKRLDEALNLSVSSTMGGSIGQRQSMNLNYSISNKVQIEGVYELRTNDEGQEDVIDNSIGGDLKFRWTFK